MTLFWITRLNVIIRVVFEHVPTVSLFFLEPYNSTLVMDVVGQVTQPSVQSHVVVYPLPWPLLLEESNPPACGQADSFSVRMASSVVTLARLLTNPGVTTWCVCGCRWRDDVCRVCLVLQRGHSGDECDLASTLCKYNLKKGDLFILRWTRVWRVRRGSISSELLMCDGRVRSILLSRCLETIDLM